MDRMEAIARYFPPDIDSDRINVLYAPFRDKTVNPKGYDAKLRTWQDAVFQYMRVNNVAHVDKEQLSDAFAFGDKKPLCLNQVITQLSQSKNLVAENDYLTSLQTNQKGWIPWAVGLGFDYLVRKPVSTSVNWAWTALLGTSTDQAKGAFISPEIVEDLSLKLCKYCCDESFREKKTADSDNSSITSSALEDWYEYDFLRKETESIIGDEKTLSIVMANLHRSGKVKISQFTVADQEKTLVSFMDAPKSISKPLTLVDPSTSTTINYKKELTEKDKALLQLNANSKELVRQIETIHSEMAKLQDTAKRYLAKGMRSLALNELKKKKRLQSKLDQQLKQLDNVDILISKLQDVDSNKMVFSAYKDAVAALNKSLSETEVESVQDTMDDMRDALDKQAELEEVLSGSTLRDLNGDAGEDELELELEQILNGSDNQEEEEEEQVVSLPDVPTDDIEDILEKLCISPVKTEKEKSYSRQLETAS